MRPAERLRAVPSATFGATLRGLRERRGMSQGELARRAGLTPSAVSNYESARRGTHLARDTVLLLASSLDVDPGPLLAAAGWEPTGLPRGSGARKAIALDGLLAEDEKQILLDLYERFTRGRRTRR